jgi:methanogenic corrinoid protein MtbC1
VTLQREAFRLARDRTSHRVLLAGAQGELHVVGLEMAGSLLLHAGYDVLVLGADLPVAEVDAAVWTHAPSVIGFTTATDATATHLPRTFEAVRRCRRQTGILVGGRAVDERWAARFDVVVCHHVADVVQHVDAFVRRATQN